MSDRVAAPPRFGMLWYWLTLALIALLIIAPVILFVVSLVITETNGCVINEATVQPCIINGSDWAQPLEGTTILGLLGMGLGGGLATVLFAVWLVVLLIHRFIWGRRAAAHS